MFCPKGKKIAEQSYWNYLDCLAFRIEKEVVRYEGRRPRSVKEYNLHTDVETILYYRDTDVHTAYIRLIGRWIRLPNPLLAGKHSPADLVSKPNFW